LGSEKKKGGMICFPDWIAYSNEPISKIVSI